jgi:hypothetical protein
MMAVKAQRDPEKSALTINTEFAVNSAGVEHEPRQINVMTDLT